MKENNSKVLVILLAILVLSLGGFIIYDKVLNNKNINDNDNNNQSNSTKRVIYKLQVIPGSGQVGTSVIYEYNPSDEKNTKKEILRNEDGSRSLEIFAKEGAIYFMNRTASYYGKSKLYNVDLKSIDVGADEEGLHHSLYLTSVYNTDTNEKDYKIYTTDFKDVYEYDYNFNKLTTLSEKINIKDFKVLGVLDGYAFIADNNYIYAIHLIDYKITKSNSMISYTKSDNADPLYIEHGFTLYNDTTLTGGNNFKFYTKNGDNIETKYYFDGTKFNF